MFSVSLAMQLTLSQILTSLVFISYFNLSFDLNAWNQNQSLQQNWLNRIRFQSTCSKSRQFNQKLFKNRRNRSKIQFILTFSMNFVIFYLLINFFDLLIEIRSILIELRSNLIEKRSIRYNFVVGFRIGPKSTIQFRLLGIWIIDDLIFRIAYA